MNLQPITVRKKLKYAWYIGCNTSRVTNVCRERFMICYDMKHCYLEQLCADVKKGLNSSATPLSDKSNVSIRKNSDTGKYIQDIINKTKQQGLNITREQISMMKLPNSVDAIIAYGWMEFYFNLLGDTESNIDEVHLDPVTIESIFAEYCFDMGSDEKSMPNCGIKPLSKTVFVELWKKCFPYVKIRQFKNVSGKCKTCARLSYLRRKYRGKKQRELITKLFYLHRTAYMGERCTYAQRIQLAKQSPQEYLSLATDGMQQAHCLLPYHGNLDNFSTCLPQHFQGVLVHGRVFNMFRTYHTLRNTSDCQIHTLLLTLEQIYKENGNHLPDHVSIQIDGGSENTDKNVLAMCELLVIMRLTQCVLLTRLMVGHTHIDVDGFFGRLWKYIRNKFIFTPGDYFTAIIIALSTAIMACRVYDIYVVPNYHQIIRPCIDPAFGLYARDENTQLQFEITACERCPAFPNGSKIRYRKYTQDKVVVLKQVKGKSVIDLEERDCDGESDDEDNMNITIDNVHVSWQPEAKYDNLGNMTSPEGMYILHHLPKATHIQPRGLTGGSRTTFDTVMSKIRSYFHTNPKVIKEWEDWYKNHLPRTDSVKEYLELYPNKFIIPFKQELFGGILPDVSSFVPAEARKTRKLLGSSLVAREVKATASVSWGENGKKHKVTKDVEPFEVIGGISQSYELKNPSEIRKAHKEIKTIVSSKSNVKKRKQHDRCESSSSDSEFNPSERASSNTTHVSMNCWRTNEYSQCTMIQNRNKAQDVKSKKLTSAHAWADPRNTPPTALEKNRVSEIFDGNEEDDLDIIIDKFDIVMVQRNLKCLRSSNTMLNDEVVNFSLKLIKQRDERRGNQQNLYFLSQFYQKLTEISDNGNLEYDYNFNLVRNWNKKVNIFSFERIFLPICRYNHWILVVINFPEKRIQFYDSLATSSCKCIDFIFELSI